MKIQNQHPVRTQETGEGQSSGGMQKNVPLSQGPRHLFSKKEERWNKNKMSVQDFVTDTGQWMVLQGQYCWVEEV